jgi:CIC family chloride channel protein
MQKKIEREVADMEKREFLESEARRRFLVPRAAIVGAVTGLMAVGFRLCLESVNHWRESLFHAAHEFGIWGFLCCILFSSLMAGAGVYAVVKFAPETKGSGIPHLKGVLLGIKNLRPLHILIVKPIAGILALGSGLVMGREGPTLQMGGASGALMAKLLKIGDRDRNIFLASGAAAGLSAAFNAPLAGLFFVLEEVQRDFAPAMFAAALVASLVADVVSRSLLGQGSAFHFIIADPPSLKVLPAYIVLGLMAGLLGVIFNRALLGGLNFWAKRSVPVYVPGLAVGALVGGIGFFLPDVLGGGHNLIESVFETQSSSVSVLWMLPAWMLLRFVLSISSYSTGAAGGFFLPVLSLGAQLGLLVGLGTQKLVPALGVQPGNLAVVGMAALFAASVRAPLTSIVLIMEMTNGYSLILPLLTACLCAYGVADVLGDLPIYEALLERDLEKDAELAAEQEMNRVGDLPAKV